MKINIGIIKGIVNVIDKVTSKDVTKDKIEETIRQGSKSRTIWFNIGLIIVGLLGAFTPIIKEHLSPENFGLFVSIVGILGSYFRATTVTPKGVFGRDEPVTTPNSQNSVDETKL